MKIFLIKYTIKYPSGYYTVTENGGIIPPWWKLPPIGWKVDKGGSISTFRWDLFHLKVELQYFPPLSDTAC
jgi:hypothetical protein